MTTIHSEDIDTMHVPPACQGQMVEVSYGIAGADGVGLRRIYDRSDRTTQWQMATEVCQCVGECNCWDPINTEPAITGEWVPVQVID